MHTALKYGLRDFKINFDYELYLPRIWLQRPTLPEDTAMLSDPGVEGM